MQQRLQLDTDAAQDTWKSVCMWMKTELQPDSGCGCLLSHEGGGRIQRVFLTRDWLETANVVTVYMRVVLNSDSITLPNPTRSDSLGASIYRKWTHVCLGLLQSCPIVTSLYCAFFPSSYLLPCSPCTLETLMVGLCTPCMPEVEKHGILGMYRERSFFWQSH